MRRPALLPVAAALALAGGGALIARSAYLTAKAGVAAILIDVAWDARLRDGRPHRPWPWADFTPVARLEIQRLRIDRPVLSDASGRTLAFGLGRVAGGDGAGSRGPIVLAGHRDSWAAFLRDLREGDAIVLRTPAGARRYSVGERRVADRAAALGLLDDGDDALVIATCWPFDGLWRGPLRYLVVCRANPVRSAATRSSAGPASGPRRGP